MTTLLLTQSVLVLTLSVGVRINVIIWIVHTLLVCEFVCRSGSLMRVCESHVTFYCLDSNIAFLRKRLSWSHTVLSTFGCANLCLRLLCIHPSMFHTCWHAEALVITEHNFFANHARLSNKTCPFSSMTSCMNVFTQVCWELFIFRSVKAPSGSSRSYFFRTDCLLPCHKFTRHGLESRTNHFTISIFYFRKSLDDLEKVLSRKLVMFHAAECFVHDEANCVLSMNKACRLRRVGSGRPSIGSL